VRWKAVYTRLPHPGCRYSSPLSAGASFDVTVADCPFLVREDILAAIAYAALQTDHMVLQSKCRFSWTISSPPALPRWLALFYKDTKHYTFWMPDRRRRRTQKIWK
jgi:hypothetical protein